LRVTEEDQMQRKPWLVVSLFLAACGAPSQNDEAGSVEMALQGGELADAFEQERAGLFLASWSGCTATRIGSRYFITAAHCAPHPQEKIYLYPRGNEYDPESYVTIVAVGVRPGVSASSGYYDSTGLFADIAILRTTPVPAGGNSAKISWAYPGADKSGVKVGAGIHEGNENLFGLLLKKGDYTYWSDDDDGRFRTSEAATNDGDSGGPFYRSNAVLGVMSHKAWELKWRATYTSTSRHLDWILDVIDYVWSGGPVTDRRRTGPIEQTLSNASLLRCQYACENTGTCVAFTRNKATKQCNILNGVTSTGALDGNYESALKAP
jgi:hypothetical protein